MSLALEINDAGLILAADGEVLAEAPGFALLEGRRPVTGEAAVRRARLAPLYVDNRYWLELGTGPLARPSEAARSSAELAHAQLVDLLGPWKDRGSELLVAVPEWYTREQLALLLGIVAESGSTVVGLVDAGLAAASLEPAPDQLVHLELALHGAVLTVLEHGGSELRRVRFEMLPGLGWLALQQAWLARIADVFVRRTRFDPLHEAASEQRLADALPGASRRPRAVRHGSLRAAGRRRRHSRSTSMRRNCGGAVERIYEEYQRLRRPGARARCDAAPAGVPPHGRAARTRDAAREPARLRAATGAARRGGARRAGARTVVAACTRRTRAGTTAAGRAAAGRGERGTGATGCAGPACTSDPRTCCTKPGSTRSTAGRLTLGSEVPAGRRGLRVPAGPGSLARPLHAARGRRGRLARGPQHLRHAGQRRTRRRTRGTARRRSPAARPARRGMPARARGGRRWRGVRPKSSACPSWT